MLRPLFLTGLLLAAPAFAETSVPTMAQDRYEAGSAVRFDGPEVADRSMAGNRVMTTAPVGGSAHLAGRRVTVEAAVAGDPFAVGYDVTIGGAVGGDASVSGYGVTLGDVTGNLRAAGAEVEIGAADGYGLITGAEVTLQGAVAGDAVLVVGEIDFGPGASVARAAWAVPVPYGTTSATTTALFDAIPARQSTRSDYDGTPVRPDDLDLLAAAAAMSGVDLVLITAADQITRLTDLIDAANTAQIADPAFVAELKHWLRFSPHAAMTMGDGLCSAASGSPALTEWLGPHRLDAVFTAKSEDDKIARQIATSAGIAVFAGAAADPANWVQVGRAGQRFALQATALGLKCAYLNQPVEVADFRADPANLVGLPGRRPDLLIRFGRGPAMPYSARRPVEAVMA